jgi:spore coat polysaccharide biosynthesis protein SpsF
MRVVTVIQARMSSTRLPGKVLREVNAKPLLGYQIERLRRVKKTDDLVVATTVNPADDLLVEFCRRQGVNCLRGDEDDVLSRYHRAGEQFGAEAVVRITADCPLIDPGVIDRVIETYRDDPGKYDYVANTLERTYPRGMDCEVVPWRVLDEAHREATTLPEREHVTKFIYDRPERYRLRNVAYSSDQSAHRWTVDTPEDFELIRRILEALYPDKPQFTLEDCLGLLRQHPAWSELNCGIKQKN